MTKKSVSLTVHTALSQFTALKRVMKTCMHIIRFHLQALDKSDWDLARELVRFLRTIDPDEMTGGSQDGGQMVTSAALRGMTSCPQSPPISAISAEEEISHLLGTLQGNHSYHFYGPLPLPDLIFHLVCYLIALGLLTIKWFNIMPHLSLFSFCDETLVPVIF